MPEKVKVSVVKCPDYQSERVYSAVKKSLGLIGFRFPKGKKVLIKPNMLTAIGPEKAVTTHPALVEAVCRLAKEAGCKVAIGESSGYFGYSGGTRNSFRVCGLEEVAEKCGAEILTLETCGIKEVPNNNPAAKTLKIAKPALEADLVVNLPKMKTHALTMYTGAVKNIFGCVPGGIKQEYHIRGGDAGGLAGILVDIYQKVMPGLAIMDGIWAMEGEGPSIRGKRKDAGLLLASANGVALDFEASRIMGFDPMEIPTNRIASERGLLPVFEVAGEKGISIPFEKAGTMMPKYVPRFLLNMAQDFLRMRPEADRELCKKCGACAKACPVKAIAMEKGKNFPEISKKKCIRCYCCQELCPYGAMKLNRNVAAKLIVKMVRG